MNRDHSARTIGLRDPDESAVRIVLHPAVDEGEPLWGIERVLSAELVAFLFERVQGAVFVLDQKAKVLAMNRPAAELVRRRGSYVVKVIGQATAAIAHTPFGSFRLVRRHVAASGGRRHLVVLAEPVAIKANDLHRIAIARWRPTRKQAEVLSHILEGLSNKEIARAMGLSPRTVEVHVTALFGKAGVESRTRLIARARELGAAAPRRPS